MARSFAKPGLYPWDNKSGPRNVRRRSHCGRRCWVCKDRKRPHRGALERKALVDG